MSLKPAEIKPKQGTLNLHTPSTASNWIGIDEAKYKQIVSMVPSEIPDNFNVESNQSALVDSLFRPHQTNWLPFLLDAVIANKLPGPGTIYISQSMRFVSPMRPGDTVHAEVKVKELIVSRSRVVLTTTCRVSGAVVVEGEATVKTTSVATT